jgi:HEAT repeat protein
MAAIPVLAVRRGSAPAPLVTALTAALASPTWQDRKVAAENLGRLGSPATLAAIAGPLAIAAADPSGFVREAVATALGQLAAAGATGPVGEALLTLAGDELAPVRAAGARALAYVKDPRAASRRHALEADPDPVVRAAAAATIP